MHHEEPGQPGQPGQPGPLALTFQLQRFSGQIYILEFSARIKLGVNRGSINRNGRTGSVSSFQLTLLEANGYFEVQLKLGSINS